MRIVCQVFGFMRFWPSDHPADRAIPDEVHDPGTFQIDRGNIAVDRLLGPFHEFRLDVFKPRDVHSVRLSYSGPAAMLSCPPM